MKRLALAAILFCASAATAEYLGSWKIDDYLPIKANTHRFSTGAAYDASSITYRIYEDETAVEIVTDTAMTKFDSETGFYLDREQLTAASGFEQGKCYTVLIKATVDSVAGTASHTFQIQAETNTAGTADAVWDEAMAGHTTETTFGGELQTLDPNLTLVLADTAELQTDWTNGGRLDLLVDAIKAMTDLMAVQTTTIAGPNDANNFTITAGRDVNDAYWMHAIMVEDADDSHSEVRWIEEYVTSRDVTVDEPFSFTPAAGDNVWILGPVYGGLLYEIRSALDTSQAPIYYYDATGAHGGAGGTTYYDESGDDP